MTDPSQEFRDWHDKILADEARRFGRLLDAMLLEAQNLRRSEGHKARERTLSSADMDHASRNPLRAAE
jgi:hypothetical protein